MKTKLDMYMLTLFLISFMILFVGFGLFPLLPSYATQLGATPTLVGVYFGVIYLTNALGTWSAGKLVNRFSTKNVYMAATLAGIPSLLLMSKVQNLWVAIFLTSIVWFSGGVDLTLINVFVGRHAKGKNLGKSFSLMSLAVPFGSLIGGLSIGHLVEWQGFKAMFMMLTALWSLLPVLGWFVLRNTASNLTTKDAKSPLQTSTMISSRFYIVVFATTIASVAISISRLGTPMLMQILSFSTADIASSATVSGLVTIPTILLVGQLSTRIGIRSTLSIGYLLAAVGTVILSSAGELWQFWFAAAVMMVAFSVSSSMSSALAAEMLDPQSLGVGLSKIHALSGVGSIISFVGTGYLMEVLEPMVLFAGTTMLSLGAVVTLFALSEHPLSKAAKSLRFKLISSKWLNHALRQTAPEPAVCNAGQS